MPRYRVSLGMVHVVFLAIPTMSLLGVAPWPGAVVPLAYTKAMRCGETGWFSSYCPKDLPIETCHSGQFIDGHAVSVGVYNICIDVFMYTYITIFGTHTLINNLCKI